jgi:hypothetical protein
MPAFTIGEQITSTLSHYADSAVGDLEYRLVDLDTGDPATDWTTAGIVQTTETGDGPPWVYESSTSSGALPTGLYQPQWRILPDGGPWIDDDEIILSVSTTSWDPPEPDDLAALMFARVTGEFGAAQNFTTTSRPTIAQAQTKIAMAMGLIAAQVGFDLDAKYHPAARAIVILQAALLTEPGYWPEDLKDYRSAQDEWRLERDAALKGLRAALLIEAAVGHDNVSSGYMTRIDGNSDDISAEDTHAFGTLDGAGRVGWRFANVHGDEPIWLPE